MINGFYTSASGMNVQLVNQDVLANNLANVNTPGYKKDFTVVQAFPNVLLHRIDDRADASPVAVPPPWSAQASPMIGEMGKGAEVAGVVTDYADGATMQTHNPLDLALRGNAMFTVQMPDGSYAYTRAGNFTLNSQDQLVTQAGQPVMGRRGPIVIQPQQSGSVVIDAKGQVTVDGSVVDNLMLTTFQQPNDLAKQGSDLYVSKDGVGLTTDPSQLTATVQQGYLENSNVSAIQEMVNMISVLRAYESDQKSIMAQDQTLNAAVNQVGNLSAT